MENYCKGKNVEEPLEKDKIPIENLPENFIWMTVSGGSKIQNLLRIALAEFPKNRSIVWSGSGPAVGKTVSCAEIMKKKHRNELHQITKICFRTNEEYWDPVIKNLDQLVVKRKLPVIHILLSMDPLDIKELGYQGPRSTITKGLQALDINKKEKTGKRKIPELFSGNTYTLLCHNEMHILLLEHKKKKNMSSKQKMERSVRVLKNEEANFSFEVPGISYFNTTLKDEISRLTAICKTWNTYKENSPNLTEDTKDLIDVAVGQANLLMNKKFQQFRKLIISCENGFGEVKPITCEDLQGFWDMINIQVENLNAKFDRLTELSNRDWEDDIPIVLQTKVKQRRIKKEMKGVMRLSLRATIEAGRAKVPQASTSYAQNTVFNGGFFVIQSPEKRPHFPEKLKTPVKEMRKSDRKSVGSPGVTMMKASQTAKSLECLNDSLFTPVKNI